MADNYNLSSNEARRPPEQIIPQKLEVKSKTRVPVIVSQRKGFWNRQPVGARTNAGPENNQGIENPVTITESRNSSNTEAIGFISDNLKFCEKAGNFHQNQPNLGTTQIRVQNKAISVNRNVSEPQKIFDSTTGAKIPSYFEYQENQSFLPQNSRSLNRQLPRAQVVQFNTMQQQQRNSNQFEMTQLTNNSGKNTVDYNNRQPGYYLQNSQPGSYNQSLPRDQNKTREQIVSRDQVLSREQILSMQRRAASVSPTKYFDQMYGNQSRGMVETKSDGSIIGRGASRGHVLSGHVAPTRELKVYNQNNGEQITK